MRYFLLLFSLITISLYAVPSLPLESSAGVASLFPNSAEELESVYQAAKKSAVTQIQQILSIVPKKRTFENTVLAYDRAVADFRIWGSVIATLKMVHPDQTLRKKAEELLLAWTENSIDLFETNREIFRAIKEYQARKEMLNEERRYYFAKAMSAFQRAGLELDSNKFQQMKRLQKEIASLSIQFHTNIAQDASRLLCKKEDLTGLDDAFINSLKREGDAYLLFCDYPTAFQLLTSCDVESTRRAYFHTFHQRAFPQNLEILTQLINSRDKLAHLLEYDFYADYDLATEMAKTSERVEIFLEDLALASHPKIKSDWDLLKSERPESVALTPDGKVKGWDATYLSNHYVKKHLQVDQDTIATYFPMESTIQGLLNVYERFFNLHFQVVSGQLFWDPSVQMIEVRQKAHVIGYILLDLFPRENKYSHACCNCIVPPMSAPALAVVIANFSRPTAERPSLLKHREVITFFHEFGHALHTLLGKAEMPTKAAYNTTIDFVETPSQLLEEWMWDRDILKLISRHYQTEAPLPDAMIEGLLQSRMIGDAAHVATFCNGDFVGTGLLFSRLSLNLFKEGQNKDLVQIEKEVYETTPQIIAYDPEIQMLCAFGHLTAYGAKYYSYQWSKQLAMKIFAYIKAHGGLLDPAMGQRYIFKIIGRGGSCDPQMLMDDFLGTLTIPKDIETIDSRSSKK